MLGLGDGGLWSFYRWCRFLKCAQSQLGQGQRDRGRELVQELRVQEGVRARWELARVVPEGRWWLGLVGVGSAPGGGGRERPAREGRVLGVLFERSEKSP